MSRSGDRPSLLTFYHGFKLGHDRFLPHPFPFVVNYHIIGRYIISISVSKNVCGLRMCSSGS
jgi:hypothetical protein